MSHFTLTESQVLSHPGAKRPKWIERMIPADGAVDEGPTDADIERLITEAVHAADYGLGRAGCPFCSGVARHIEDCIAVVFGATGEDPDAEWYAQYDRCKCGHIRKDHGSDGRCTAQWTIVQTYGGASRTATETKQPCSCSDFAKAPDDW